MDRVVRASGLVPPPPVIIFMVGTNNIHKGELPIVVFKRFRDLVATTKRVYPEAKIMLCTVLPRLCDDHILGDQVREVNRLLFEHQEELGYVVINTWRAFIRHGSIREELYRERYPGGRPDRLHANFRGYVTLNTLLRMRLSDALGKGWNRGLVIGPANQLPKPC